jgi:hypothetical protein
VSLARRLNLTIPLGQIHKETEQHSAEDTPVNSSEFLSIIPDCRSYAGCPGRLCECGSARRRAIIGCDSLEQYFRAGCPELKGA